MWRRRVPSAGWRLVRREKRGKVDCRVRPLQHSSTVTQRHCVEYLCVEYLQDFHCANVERSPKFLESAIKKEKITGKNCVEDVEAVSRFVEAVKTVKLCRAAVELSIL